MKWKKIVWIIVSTFIVLLPIQSLADHTDGEYHIFSDVYTFYDLANNEKFEAAANQLQQLLEGIQAGHLTVQGEKQKYLEDKIKMIMLELNSDLLTPEMKKENARSFVLMMETAYDIENESYVQAKKALKNQILQALESDYITFEREYVNIAMLYQNLLPSLKMEVDQQKWKDLDNQLARMVELDNLELMEENLNIILNYLDPIEVSVVEEEDDSSFIWLLTTIGGTIIFTLFYVGWRKYKGEKKNREKEKYKKVDGY